jgi:aspartate-semialdehyde dehydrogenase
MVEKYRVAIVGAAELVGQELVHILEERQFPVSDINLYATDSAEQKSVVGIRHSYPIQSLDHSMERRAFQATDIVFFTEGDSTSRHLVPRAVQAGATVIDSSSVFRMEADVPLVVPEVNASDLQEHQGIIASPGCSTIILNTALYPLHKANPVKRVIVATYQSVSGAGIRAMSELTEQTQRMMAGGTSRPLVFPHQIGFNVLPQVDVFLDNGYTKEEWQLLDETRKMLHNDDILISATCARVPVYKGHCQAVTIDFTSEINPEIAGNILAEARGVRLVDETGINLYPQPRTAAGMDEVMAGRIRQDTFNLNSLVLWLAADNIRKGAALNLVQIAEEIIKKGWLKAKGQR